MRLPFLFHGPITPATQEACQAMEWHTDLLSELTSAILARPPAYFTIVAPPQGGKTTLARQLQSRLTTSSNNTLPVALDLGSLGSSASEQEFCHYFEAASLRQLAHL